LQSSDAADRPRLIGEELSRLESLEARIRSRDAGEPEKMANRLEALEQMRGRLSPHSGG
jgi:hypothetical protein